MVPHFAAGLFGLLPIVVFPLFGVDPPGDAGGGSQVSAEPGDPASPGDSAPKFFYSISCVEGSTGQKTFRSEDEFCTALRGEQVCSESAAFFAFLQGCP